MNARFWTFYKGGFVKITLKPNQTLSCGYSQPDEEGFGYYCETWTYRTDLNQVLCDTAEGGRDCDGRIDNYWSGYCPIGELKSYPIMRQEEEWDYENQDYKKVMVNQEMDGQFTPGWIEESASQRDQYAEMEGY